MFINSFTKLVSVFFYLETEEPEAEESQRGERVQAFKTSVPALLRLSN